MFLFQLQILVNISKNIRVPNRDACAICHAVSSALSLDNGLATTPSHVGRPAIAVDFGVGFLCQPTHGQIFMIGILSVVPGTILVSPHVDYHCYESKWYIVLVLELILTILTASFMTLISLPTTVEGTGDAPKDGPMAAHTRKPSQAKATKGKVKAKAKVRNKQQRMESLDILVPEDVGSEVMSRDAFVARRHMHG